MVAEPILAIDVMGGDEGAPVTLEAAELARRRYPELRYMLFGNEQIIKAGLADLPKLAERCSIVHTDVEVKGNDKPSQVLRSARKSSMGLAVNAVKAGDAHAAVSAGNTGALMAMAKLALRTMPGVDRPALAAMLPTLGDNDAIMLDLGANTECDARNLVQFAVMGAAYARIALDLDRPRVRLLNIGTEELKGTDEIRDAAAVLRAANDLSFQFDGFTEGDKIARGDTDVIVCDGFSGNVALKTAEGTARFVTDVLRKAFTSSIRSKIGFLISKPAMYMLKHHLDPNNHNGAVFLGLNGVVVKSHGGADEKGVANAVHVAARLLEEDITRRIAADMAGVEGLGAVASKLEQPVK